MLSQHIAEVDPSHRGLYFIRTVRDSFNIQGPDGTHVCLVYEPMREPVWLFQRRLPDGRYTPNMLKHTIKFMLYALEYLHDCCHVIHTGARSLEVMARKR